MTIDEFTKKIPGRLSITYKQLEAPSATLGAMAATQDNRPAETKKPWCAGLESDHWMDCGYGDTQEEALDALAAKMLAKKRTDVASKKKWLAEAEGELAALGVALGVAQAKVLLGAAHGDEPLVDVTAALAAGALITSVGQGGGGGSGHGHERVECSCGAVIRQCRCMGPKTVTTIPNACPKCAARAG